MPITTIYEIRHNLFEWVAVIDDAEYNRNGLLGKIKSMVRAGFPVEEEWSAFAILDRRMTEERWLSQDTVGHFHRHLPQYER